jgi:peptide/nickel transport system substrate-binding protein
MHEAPTKRRTVSEDHGYEIDVSRFLGAKVTRRSLLKGGAAAGAVAAIGPLAGACGGTTSDPSPSSSAGAAKKGGVAKVGIVGGSSKDTADPHNSAFEPDEALNWLMFEGLVEFSPDYKPTLVLAEEVTANADATEWTVKVRQGVLWHDGKPLTADDVVYSFKRIVDPKNPLQGASGLPGLTPAGITKVDAQTVKFTLEKANVLFGTDGLASRLVHVVPVDFDPMKPIGTGAFKLETFRPGEQFEFSAFADYHDGPALLDGITVIEFADPTARVNALLSGVIDALMSLPPSQLTVLEATPGMVALNAKSGGWIPIVMRVDQKPFDDVRVRQAFRLIADRQQIMDQAYAGVAWLGNDIYSPFDPGYPSQLPQRAQDLEQAKSLLKQAGYDNDLTVELVTGDAAGSGAVDAAQVYSEQAKGAGVTVKVNKVDSAVLFGEDYTKWTFSMTYWGLRNYLQQAAVCMMPGAPYDETHWDNAKWLSIVTEAFSTVDDTKRNALITEAATMDYNEGGYIIPTFKNQLDAYSSKLGGFVTNDVMGISFGRWRFHGVYFT